MSDIIKTAEHLKANGYTVTICENSNDAALYLNRQLDNTTVGIGGSMTLEEMDIFHTLSEHNKIYWHWHPQEGETPESTLKKAASADIYLTSVNAADENGNLVNIDGTGNRLSSCLYGHRKVYFVMGENKIMPDLNEAINRARNIASPLNAGRLSRKTPCALSMDKCYDCKSTDRICNAMVIHFKKMGSCEMEVIIIKESLGF